MCSCDWDLWNGTNLFVFFLLLKFHAQTLSMYYIYQYNDQVIFILTEHEQIYGKGMGDRCHMLLFRWYMCR